MSQCYRTADVLEKVLPKDNIRKISDVEFAGLLDPFRPENTIKGYAPQGATVYEIIEAACKANKVHKRHIKFGVAQIGVRDLERGVIVWKPVHMQAWRKRRVREGELVRFRLMPRGGGGGGGKNPLRTILQLAVTVVAVVAAKFTFGTSLGLLTGNASSVATALASIGGVSTSAMVGAGIAAGAVGLAVTTLGSMLINAIAPVKPAGITSSSSRKESPTYEISAGRNNVNTWGRVPVPLGRGRFAPPYAALPYTVVQNDDQYSHALFCIGIGDVNISDIRIGDTNVKDYVEVAYEYFKYDPENPSTSNLYPTGVIQEDLNIELLHDEWNVRTTTECDKANVDIQFNGIGYANNNGGIDTVCTEFMIQYKKYGEGNSDDSSWDNTGDMKWIEGVAIPWQRGYTDIGVDYDKGIKFFPSSRYGDACTANGYSYIGKVYEYTRYYCVGGGDSGCNESGYRRYTEIVDSIKKPLSGVYLSGFGLSASAVSGGWISKTTAESQVIKICGAQTRTLRKTFEILFPERGKYDVRVKRLTEDSEDSKRNDRSFWVAFRSLSNDLPVSTPYPVNLLAVKIKATGQLSGAIDTLSLYYETEVLDWDSVEGTWIKRYTSNPASLFRHILQDRLAMARPQSDDAMDFDSIVDAHEYWENKGWEFNIVCDSDQSVFERLQEFCAAGLASPTMIDGKWGIIVDKPRDYIACAFTESNSWNWSFQKTQVLMPNEIHCNFINEATWTQDMRIVPTDEPVRDNYLFETQDFTGVNKPDQVYQLARFHYADAKVRRRFITLRAYDEALLCTRGDLVSCSAPSVYPYGLQNGRIRTIFLDEEDRVAMIETDQAQATDYSGRRFGVQIFNDDGDKIQVEILPENKNSTFLKLKNPQKLPIQLGNKYAFGDFGEETFNAIVLGMKFNSDMTCDITLQDYVPLIYGSLDEPIPDWTSPITPPVIIECTNLKAYEVWQYDSSSKSGRSYIQVYWNGDASNWNVFVAIDDETPRLHGSTATNSYIIDPVTLLTKYTIYVTPRSTSTNANRVSVYTLGKQAPPSPVLEFMGNFYKDTITFNWTHIPDHDRQGYELRYGKDWQSSITIASGIADNTYNWMPPADGTYKFMLKSIDTFGNYSNEYAELIMTVDVEEGLNIIAGYEELPDYVDEAELKHHFTPTEEKHALVWTPAMTNMVEPEYTNLSFEDYAGGSSNGVYITKVHDIGVKSTAYLRIIVDYDTDLIGNATNLTFPTRTNMTYPYDTNLSITAENKIKIEYRLSDDGVQWTDWISYIGIVNVKARFYQARISTLNDSIDVYTKISRIGVLVDVPDKIVVLKEQVIPIEGREYSLQEINMYPIYVQYVVGVTVLGEAGKYAVIEKFEDRFKVRCFDETGAVGSVVDLEIRGF